MVNEISIGQVDLRPRADVIALFEQMFSALDPGGIVTMTVTDFQYFVQTYIENRVPTHETDKLLVGNRQSLWNEQAIVNELMKVGFYKVWTGRVANQALWEFTAKAIKK